MTAAATHQVERRNIPGSRYSVSAITVTVDPPAVAPPSVDARTVALLQRAREWGITTFDVAGARHPERAERLIARAFPSTDPAVGVIVGRSVESLAREAASPESAPITGDLLGRVLRSLESSGKRLAPVPIVVVEWELAADAEGGGASQSGPQPFPDRDSEGPMWAMRLDSSTVTLPPVPGSAALYAADLSLLDHRAVRLFEDTLGPPDARLLARNPFAGGRLDGTRFAATTAPSGPAAGAVDLRRLHTEFDPVLRLGFLTEDRRRTLAQAALQFVLGWPWVVTAVIPLPEPGRFEELLGWDAVPHLSDEDRRSLGFLK